MGEHQISVGSATYPLPRLFLVMATQNPIEHEGTYPLPEAQLDRFMLHALVDYPDRATTLRIMALNRREAIAAEELPAPASKLSQETVIRARPQIPGLTLIAAAAEYGAALVDAHRRPTTNRAHLPHWLH